MYHDLKYWIDQFQSIYTGPNWIGDSILSVVDELDSKIAFQKPPRGQTFDRRNIKAHDDVEIFIGKQA
jgi:hypothetical protein